MWFHPFAGYRPWAWPLLGRAAERQRARVAALAGRLNDPVFEVLGFPDGIATRMSRSSLAFLGPGDRPEGVTVRDFVTESGNGAEPRDVEAKIGLNDRIVARIAAARLSKWLERMVLASQDILVDAPHLVERMPVLLAGDRGDEAAWQATVNLEEPAGLDLDAVASYRIEAEDWLSRPAFWWPLIDDDEGLRARRLADARGNALSLVFREDVSNFGPSNESREFVAAFHSAFDRRWAAAPGSPDYPGADVGYGPSVRFAM